MDVATRPSAADRWRPICLRSFTSSRACPARARRCWPASCGRTPPSTRDERAGRADDPGAARHLRAAERGGDLRRRGDAPAPAARRRRRLLCAARRQGGGLRHQPRLVRPAAGDPGALPRVQGHRLRARRGVDHRQLRAAVPEEPVRDLAHARTPSSAPPSTAAPRRWRAATGWSASPGRRSGRPISGRTPRRCSSSNTTGWSRTPVRASPRSTISSGSRDSSTTSTTSSTTSPSSTASSRRRACTRSGARSPGAPRPTLLPPDLFARLHAMTFWRHDRGSPARRITVPPEKADRFLGAALDGSPAPRRGRTCPRSSPRRRASRRRRLR